MTRSPTAQAYYEALFRVKAFLEAERAPGKTLEGAAEVRVGLHADEDSFQPTGVYVLPAADRIGHGETWTFDHGLRIRVLACVRAGYVTADSDQSNDTIVLTDLLGAIVDLVKEEAYKADPAWVTFAEGGENAVWSAVESRKGTRYVGALHVVVKFETQVNPP